MKTTILFLLCLIISISSSASMSLSSVRRAQDLLAKMTLEEKLTLVHGGGNGYAGVTPAISRLNIPELHLEDGPQGVGENLGQVTGWPSALTVIASWDTELMREWAMSLGAQQRLKGTNVMLGPMVNLARVPFGGRNFESFGEDPCLASKMVAESIKGVQSQGVIATVKHFVDNNQEYNRTSTSSNVPERAQWELYYPAFQAAVDAGVGSVMCSYNKINDTYACENNQTLNRDLKERMGFKGFVMSDWGATHSTVLAANSGLDQQMPDASFFGAPLTAAVAAGTVSKARVDDMATRILTPMFEVGIFDFPQEGNTAAQVDNEVFDILARRIGREANVLLKNDDNILPIQPNKVRTIAVIGDDAHAHPISSGDGSGRVNNAYLVTPLEGITNRAGGALAGQPDGAIKVVYAQTGAANLTTVAKNADLAIVFVGIATSEGLDRTTLSLGSVQDAMIEAVAAAQPNTVVVLHVAGSVLMPWANSVKGIVCAFLPGQEDGNAISLILFGDYNPSGKLPITFPVSDKQIPISTLAQYPGIGNQVAYSEELLIGYRWYDATNEQPLFEFGHGLSYTTFGYTNLQTYGAVKSGNLMVSIDVTNTGAVFGAEVAQLYLNYPAEANEPPKVLRGFKKVGVSPGEKQTVVFDLLKDVDFSIWDVTTHDWKLVNGTFGILAGSSSRDIRLKGFVTI